MGMMIKIEQNLSEEKKVLRERRRKCILSFWERTTFVKEETKKRIEWGV
jgi:hypothetical protein